jgi:protein TonB
MSMLNPTLPGQRGRLGDRVSLLATFAGVAAVHAVVLILLATFVPAEKIAEFVRPLTVRMIELAPEVPEAAEPPPPPPRPRPVKPRPAPAPIVAVSTPAPPTAEAPTFTVAAAPAPEPVAVPPAPTFVPAPPAPPAPITQARFDAAYLNNPKPVYPASSRRLGEEGKVVLRVHVGPEGRATDIELRNTSGFPRLDTAAKEAVAQWRFVPARRGDEPIAAWVVVPIVFSLES